MTGPSYVSLSKWCLIVLWNSGSVDFLFCAPPGSSSWVSSFRDVIGRRRHGRPAMQPAHKEQVRMGTLLALRGATACVAAQERGIPWIVEQFQPQANWHFRSRRVDRSFANAGGTVIVCLSPLARTRIASPSEWPAFLSLCFCSARAFFERPRGAASCICRKCF